MHQSYPYIHTPPLSTKGSNLRIQQSEPPLLRRFNIFNNLIDMLQATLQIQHPCIVEGVVWDC